MNPVAIIQARLSSTRLPGKILFPLSGKTVIERVVERSLMAVPNVVIATACDGAELVVGDILEEQIQRNGVRIVSGDTYDVLSRYVKALRLFPGDPVIRITSDCPLICPEVITSVLEEYRRFPERKMVAACTGVGVTTTGTKRFPDGLDVEVIPSDWLIVAEQRATGFFERVHVTPYLWGRDEFSKLQLEAPEDYFGTKLSLDNLEDYRLIRRIYSRGNPITLSEIMKLYRECAKSDL